MTSTRERERKIEGRRGGGGGGSEKVNFGDGPEKVKLW